jgi:hypothetical protein
VKEQLITAAAKTNPSLRKQTPSALRGIFAKLANPQRFLLSFFSAFDPTVNDKYVAEQPSKSAEHNKAIISSADYYDFMEGTVFINC